MPSPRRFPPPWSAEVQPNYYVVRDANGQQIAYIYYECESGRRSAAKFLAKMRQDALPRISPSCRRGQFCEAAEAIAGKLIACSARCGMGAARGLLNIETLRLRRRKCTSTRWYEAIASANETLEASTKYR